jgi:hypothetical protein
MGTTQPTREQQWDLAFSQLREAVPQAIAHLRRLEAVTETSYDSSEMGPEEWAEESAELEYFITPDEKTGISPEETVRRVFEAVRNVLAAGDQLTDYEEF